MNSVQEKQKMRKKNMKLFPIYKAFAWDFLFFYTIDFLFLTQIKGIEASSVVLKSTFYSFFIVVMQIPSNIIVEFLGRKNSIILGNILNCLYMVILMLTKNLGDLVFAELISAIASTIKNVAEPSLLNESVPPSKYKNVIFSKISAKGAMGYYIFNAMSKVIAGCLFAINGYLPIICSLGVLIITVIISMHFIEPVQKKRHSNDILGKKEIKEIKEGFTYILSSERLKALILSASLIVSLLVILTNYHVSLLQELKLSSVVIGAIAAIGSIISAFASKVQELYNSRLKNKTLTVTALLLSISTMVGGICGLKANQYVVLLIIVIMTNLIYNFCYGMYYTIIDKYLKSFANKQIDTKIFAAKNFFSCIVRVISGLFASFLLGRMNTAYSMIIIGVIFTILYILMEKYMKNRVGLKPEQYSKNEVKYDEQKSLLNKEKINDIT